MNVAIVSEKTRDSEITLVNIAIPVSLDSEEAVYLRKKKKGEKAERKKKEKKKKENCTVDKCEALKRDEGI